MSLGLAVLIVGLAFAVVYLYSVTRDRLDWSVIVKQFGISKRSRVALELLIALAVVGWCVPSSAQDIGIEIESQADRAVAQFKTIWSKNKSALDAYRSRATEERKSLERIRQYLRRSKDSFVQLGRVKGNGG
jgi:hypothetical protein